MRNVAEHVIEKCGGAKAVAGALRITLASVHRWKYSIARGGTGGLVPARWQAPLLAWATSVGIDLSPSDFFSVEITGSPIPVAAEAE